MTATEIREKRTPLYKKIWRLFWVGTIGFILLLAAYFLYLTTTVPSFQSLENPKSEVASEIISGDGEVLGLFFTENRLPATYNDLPEHLVDALVSTEDERFYNHTGIDFRALARVVVKTVLGGDASAGGGSTITQQLAKLLYDRPNFNNKNKLQRVGVIANTKFKEWITAVKLEKRYTKNEILTMYLNEFNFIHGAYGIRSASDIYFSKSLDSLSLEEGAMLVGMLKNPALYNPIRFPERAKDRRNVVLYQMKRNGKLSQAEYDRLKVLPVDTKRFKRADHNEGPAPYFREHVRQEVRNLLKQPEYLKADGTAYDVHKDGLKIYTTIDSRVQRYAEESVYEHFKKEQKVFFKHWKGKDPWTYRARNVTNREIELREKSFENLLRNTERYKILASEYLPKTIEVGLKDYEIERMFKEEKEPGHLAELNKKKLLSDKNLKRYRKMMKSKDWEEVKKEYSALLKAVKKDFSTKVKMKVFAYNEKGYVDTLMSPLDSLRYHRMHMQTGLMAVNPKNGHVKAWVGGVNYKYFKYDHVNINSRRQVGSTFKPFLYALSIQMRGYSPCFKVMDQPVTFHKGSFGLTKDYSPKNVGKHTYENKTLVEGLQSSINSVSAYLLKDIGNTNELRSFVYNLGIDTAQTNPNDPYSKRVPDQPSIALGAADLSVYEMAGAYTAFANNGVYSKPIYLTRIEDKNGNVIYENISRQKQVMSEQSNYAMLHLLKAVVGNRLGIKSEIGGKTGTTNYQTDAWFIGVTPELVVGTWVGGDDRWIRFRSMYGQGSKMARPIVGKLFKKLEADDSGVYNHKTRFKVPKGQSRIELDCSTYDSMGAYDDIDFENPGFNPEDSTSAPIPDGDFDPFDTGFDAG